MHIAKDGNELAVDIWLLLERDENEQAVAEWAFVRDISDRRRTERQLRHTQKMLAVSRLSGGIAHDFNNFLTTILGFAELARKGAGQLPEATMREYLERVLDAGARGRDLISQMLTFSRGTAGATRASVRLGSSVREITQSLSSVMPSGIHLSLSVPEQDPAVDVDPVQLQQVLLNLCMNARDAMHGTGKLCIGVRPIHYSGRECAGCYLPVNGSWIELSVADTGQGIPAAIEKNIFDPFFTTKKRGEGSGLGLSVLHGVMHGHDGHVLVESDPQEGTTFRVLFPGCA
jgi:signal transduction histidine kinase